MAAPTLIPNMMAGNKGASDLAMANIGLQPIGNGAGSKLPGPSSVGGNPSPIPVSNPTQFNLNPASMPPALPPGVTGSPVNNPSPVIPVSSPGAGILPNSSLLPTNGVNPSTSYYDSGVSAPTPASQSETSSPKLQGELNDMFGKGVGGLLGSEIGSIGSTDDAYMQAYRKAMLQPNAEGLATLETNLGDEGISGDSSTAAIAKADYESGIVADEGLQEQQLQKNDLAELLGLTTSLEDPAQKHQADSGWSIFGNVLGDVGGAVASAFLL